MNDFIVTEKLATSTGYEIVKKRQLSIGSKNFTVKERALKMRRVADNLRST